MAAFEDITSNPMDTYQACTADLDALDQDALRLDLAQHNYSISMTEVNKHLDQCQAQMKKLRTDFTKLRNKYGILKETYPDVAKNYRVLEERLKQKQAQLAKLQYGLPKPSPVYLNFVLGSVDVGLWDRKRRLDYKEQYEQFKLWVTLVLLILSASALGSSTRAFDSLLHFTLVWFHCILTLRESILVVNGSRIKGWWRAIHFLTAVTTGLLLVWPDGPSYSKFRAQFLFYILIQAMLRFAGYYFQSGALYRLRSLGERPDEMDITMQGFHSWMWSGLAYLLPFQLIGYFLQANLAYTLVMMCINDADVVEWQVPAIAVMYGILALGNLTTTFVVMFVKAKEKAAEHVRKITKAF